MSELPELYVILVDGTYVSDCTYDSDGHITSVEIGETSNTDLLKTFDVVDVVEVITCLLTEHEITPDQIVITEITLIAKLESQMTDMQKL